MKFNADDDYTSHHGKARRASSERRLARNNGSPTLSKRKHTQTRQAQTSMGVAVVGRLHPRRRQNRATTAIGRAWLRVGNDATASEEISREPLESSESRQTAPAVHAPIRRLCGPVLRAAVLPNAQSIYSTALSPNTQHSPYTCIWRVSASRNWNRRPTAVCVAENEKRPVMGIRESFPQFNVEGLRISEEVELPLRRESRSWRFTSGEGSGSRSTYLRQTRYHRF